MNISVCITVRNEGSSIGRLLDSLLAQSKKADEIIVVDGGSKDRTIEVINHYQKHSGSIKLLRENCTRAKGRNLGVEIAKNEIIAIIDAGCVADKYWLEKITEPFKNEQVDISAGFYNMVGKKAFQKAASVFLGIAPGKFNNSFLPSTRSIAFRKSAWERIGGFPEEKENSAEDTYFNYHALKLGMKYARVKSATVEWGMPDSLNDFFKKIQSYAKWDARTKILIFPKKGLTSHNIKAFFVLLRYLIGISLLILGFKFNTLPYLIIGLFVYFVFAFRKAGWWGILLQFVSDFAVMSGFIQGFFSQKKDALVSR